MPLSSTTRKPSEQLSRRDDMAGGLSLSAALLVGPDLIAGLEASQGPGKNVDEEGMRWPADPDHPFAA